MIKKEDIELNFPDQPDVYSLNKDNAYCLRGDYVYTWRYSKLNRRLKVPNGFVYDGASIPRFLWSIFDIYPDGIHRSASLIHDYIYRCKGALPLDHYCIYYIDEWIITHYKWTRKDADRLFFRILRESGVPKIKRRIMYYAVRMFGYFWWVS